MARDNKLLQNEYRFFIFLLAAKSTIAFKKRNLLKQNIFPQNIFCNDRVNDTVYVKIKLPYGPLISYLYMNITPRKRH